MPAPQSQRSLMAEQQQQLHEPVMILNTVLKLKAIAQLDDLKDYGEALRWVVDLPNSTMALLRKKTEVSQDICSQLLGSYCTAISTGLKHLHLNWPQPFVIDTRQNSNAMFAVRTVSTLAYSPGLWREPSLSQYCSEFTCQVPDMAIKAGFFRHAAPVMCHFVPIMQQSAKIPVEQYTIDHQSLVLLTTFLLELWASLFECQRGGKLANAEHHIEAAASLALAFMQMSSSLLVSASSNQSIDENQRELNADSSSWGNTGSSKESPGLWKGSYCVGLSISHEVMYALYTECGISSSNSNNPATAAAAKDVLASVDVQRMLLLGLAASAAMMPQQSTASPAAEAAAETFHPAQLAGQQPQQQQCVQHGYLQLFEEFGIDTTYEDFGAQLTVAARKAFRGDWRTMSSTFCRVVAHTPYVMSSISRHLPVALLLCSTVHMHTSCWRKLH